MKNPCVRDCPERCPGCCCEKRRAWLAEHRDQKRRQRAETDLGGYLRDAKRDSRNRRKERWNWRHP